MNAEAIVQSSEADRTKKITRMELVNTYDNTACLSSFNKFVLKSSQLSDSYSTMFSFTENTDSSVNSEIKMIAAANQLVISPTCNLSTKPNIDAGTVPVYTQSCTFTFEMEAFVGSKSYGTYSTFTFTVKNECLGF